MDSNPQFGNNCSRKPFVSVLVFHWAELNRSEPTGEVSAASKEGHIQNPTKSLVADAQHLEELVLRCDHHHPFT